MEKTRDKKKLGKEIEAYYKQTMLELNNIKPKKNPEELDKQYRRYMNNFSSDSYWNDLFDAD